jgi:hypothetical protein
MTPTPLQTIYISAPLEKYVSRAQSVQARREFQAPILDPRPVEVPAHVPAGLCRGRIVALAAAEHGKQFAVRLDRPATSKSLRLALQDYVADPWTPRRPSVPRGVGTRTLSLYLDPHLVFSAVAISGLSISEIVRVVIEGRYVVPERTIEIPSALTEYAVPHSDVACYPSTHEFAPPLLSGVPATCPDAVPEASWRGQIVAHAAALHGRRFASRVDYPIPSDLLSDLLDDYVADPWIPTEQLHTSARYAPVRVFSVDPIKVFSAVAISGLSISEIIRVVIAGRPDSRK